MTYHILVDFEDPISTDVSGPLPGQGAGESAWQSGASDLIIESEIWWTVLFRQQSIFISLSSLLKDHYCRFSGFFMIFKKIPRLITFLSFNRFQSSDDVEQMNVESLPVEDHFQGKEPAMSELEEDDSSGPVSPVSSIILLSFFH